VAEAQEREEMNRDRIDNEASALVYMTDCTLATVTSLAMKKSRPVHEYKRQISIAQTGIDWINSMGIGPFGRPKEVIHDFGSNVAAWAARYEPLE
jgi:hypothetical protein